jgi:hypothetical protein
MVSRRFAFAAGAISGAALVACWLVLTRFNQEAADPAWWGLYLGGLGGLGVWAGERRSRSVALGLAAGLLAMVAIGFGVQSVAPSWCPSQACISLRAASPVAVTSLGVFAIAVFAVYLVVPMAIGVYVAEPFRLARLGLVDRLAPAQRLAGTLAVLVLSGFTPLSGWAWPIAVVILMALYFGIRAWRKGFPAVHKAPLS